MLHEQTSRATNGVSVDIMDRLDRLARISESPLHLTRRCYTPEYRQAADLVANWMREAGMDVRHDAVGNVIGRYEGRTPGAPAIVLGSHLDTVIMAGKYDGALGVLCAIDCVKTMSLAGTRHANAVEVMCFVDEEGVRFQSTYLGSRGVSGSWDRALLDRPDRDGITLADAMRAYGLDPDRVGDAARRPEDIRAYLEVHIEQGPVLEAEGLALAAVTAIAGANRLNVTIDGTAGHAGTVPMNRRADALTAAAECVLAVEAAARGAADAVGTVGDLTVRPGASNVIPGQVSFSVDLRAPDDQVRREARASLETRIAEITSARGLRASVVETHVSEGVACADWLIDKTEAAMADLGHAPRRLPSGAGHDAVAMAEITDVGMIFVRCKDGISHSPDESIMGEDAIAAAEVLARTVELIGNEE